jgi:hypothetical protein
VPIVGEALIWFKKFVPPPSAEEIAPEDDEEEETEAEKR